VFHAWRGPRPWRRRSQVLPLAGAVLPEDAALVAASQLEGSCLAALFERDRTACAAWWAAEADAARASVERAAADEAPWQRGAGDEGVEQGAAPAPAWQREHVRSEAVSAVEGAVSAAFQRCMWLGSACARLAMLDVVLSAALQVPSRAVSMRSDHACPFLLPDACHECSLLSLETFGAVGGSLPSCWGGARSCRPTRPLAAFTRAGSGRRSSMHRSAATCLARASSPARRLGRARSARWPQARRRSSRTSSACCSRLPSPRPPPRTGRSRAPRPPT
jgi:hypothetical protein